MLQANGKIDRAHGEGSGALERRYGEVWRACRGVLWWVKQRGGSSVLDGASEVVLHSYRSGLSAESAALLCGWVIWMSEKKMILRRERCGAMFVLCLQEYWEWMWNAKGGRGWPLRDGANGEVGVSEQGEELELWGGGKVSNRQFLKYLSWHRLSGLAMKGREMVWLTLCRLHG